ncbi:MAG: RNA pseudouridine synthase [Rikenellaceae bacterium]
MNTIEVLYQDNHLIVVGKSSGELVQPDPSGEAALEQRVAEFLRIQGNKPGAAFVGVVHRIDRPVSGAVLFAKTSKALVRLNEQMRGRGFRKIYWAIVENCPSDERGELRHYILRNAKSNKSVALNSKKGDAKEAVLRYRVAARSDRYYLLEIELLTGRHHQIRAQLSAIGSPIKGDLKYGSRRSNSDGSISLHSRSLSFVHPTTGVDVTVLAPVPNDGLWRFFESRMSDGGGLSQ